jgi:hypothetical protein
MQCAANTMKHKLDPTGHLDEGHVGARSLAFALQRWIWAEGAVKSQWHTIHFRFLTGRPAPKPHASDCFGDHLSDTS